MDDVELGYKFAKERSEKAFRMLAERHTGFVTAIAGSKSLLGPIKLNPVAF